MNSKKVFLLLISLVFMSLFSGFVFASNHEGGGLGQAFDTIKELFAFVPDLITLEGLVGGETASVFWAKFLIWIILFAAIYFGASFAFKDNKRVAMIIALAISLIGAILIPDSFLIGIFQTYGLVAGAIIWVLPVVGGMFIAKMVDSRFLKAVIYGFSAWILWTVNKIFVEEQGFLDFDFPFFMLLFTVVILMFLWNLGGIFGGEGGPATGWLGNKGKDVLGWGRNRLGRGGHGDGDGDGGDGRGGNGGGGDGDGHDEDDQEENVDLAEIVVERKALDTLVMMRKELNQVKVDNSSDTNKGHVDAAIEGHGKLEEELKEIYALERKEIKLEQLSEQQKARLGIKGNNAVLRLIRREINYENHLKGLVEGIGKDLSRRRPGITDANKKILEAINTLKLLWRINSAEIGEIRG